MPLLSIQQCEIKMNENTHFFTRICSVKTEQPMSFIGNRQFDVADSAYGD